MVSTEVQAEDARSASLRASATSALTTHPENWAALARSADVDARTLKRWTLALAAGKEIRRGAPTLLTHSEEQTLVGVALLRQALNAPLTKRALGTLAGQILARRGKKFAHERPSDEWYQSFLDRWPHLSLRKTSSLSADALTRATRANLQPFYDRVAALQATVPQARWYNADEGQVAVNDGARLVLAARGAQHVHSAAVGYSGHVTILPTVSATGEVLPTLFIFKGKHAAPELLQGAGPHDAVSVTGASASRVACLVLFRCVLFDVVCWHAGTDIIFPLFRSRRLWLDHWQALPTVAGVARSALAERATVRASG